MRKVLVIREFDDFSGILAENNFNVINLPLIETKPIEDLSEFKAKFERIENYDGFFLTSRHAAQILAETLREKNISFAGKVYVLGKRSYDILQPANLNLIFEDAANTAREMLEAIPPEDLKNKRFLFVCGERSLRVVPEFLQNFAAVDEVIVYRTEKIRLVIDKTQEIRAKFERGEIVAACFFSPSGAESFLEQFDAEVLHQTRIATIGKTTVEFFEMRNLQVDFVSLKASAEDFAVGLIEYLGKEN